MFTTENATFVPVPVLRGVSVNGNPIDTASGLLAWARERSAALVFDSDLDEALAVDSLFDLYDEVMGIA